MRSPLPQDTFTITIVDNDGDSGGNDLPQLSVQADPVAEDAGSIPVTFTLDQAAASEVSVDLEIVANGATPGEDFLAPLFSTISFPAGQTTVTFPIEILEDDIYERREFLRLRLSNPTGLVLSQTEFSLSILDNDSASVLSLDIETLPRREGDESIPINLILNQAPFERTTMNVTAIGGTAVEGSDYNLNSTVVFDRTDRTVVIAGLGSIIDDAEQEGEETIIIRLSSDEVTIPQDTFTITLLDNDPTADFPFAPNENLSFDFTAEVTTNLSGSFFEDTTLFARNEDTIFVNGPLGESIAGSFEVDLNELQLFTGVSLFEDGRSAGKTYFHLNGVDSEIQGLSGPEVILPPATVPTAIYNWDEFFDFTLQPDFVRLSVSRLSPTTGSVTGYQSQAILFNDLSAPDAGIPFTFATNIRNADSSPSGGSVPFVEPGFTEIPSIPSDSFPFTPAVGTGDTLMLRAFTRRTSVGSNDFLSKEVFYLVFNKADGSLFNEGEFPTLNLADLNLAKVILLTQTDTEFPPSTTWSYKEADITSLTNTTTTPPVGGDLPLLSVQADPIAEDAGTYLVTFSLDRPATEFVGSQLRVSVWHRALGPGLWAVQGLTSSDSPLAKHLLPATSL